MRLVNRITGEAFHLPPALTANLFGVALRLTVGKELILNFDQVVFAAIFARHHPPEHMHQPYRVLHKHAHAYKPMKGNLEQLLARTYTTPLWEDDLLSIDDALLLVGTESVQDDWIVLVKQKRGNKKSLLLIVKGGSFGFSQIFFWQNSMAFDIVIY
ncbi:hypothetical protein ACR79N_22660 [Sphingobacterium siyangense]|uniref:hypothetical protein n=1 Tax=Sphingobacterium siyangense TaxID=459529 RepID=UPI003DA3E751